MGFKRPLVQIQSLGPRKVPKSKDFGTFLFLFSTNSPENENRNKWKITKTGKTEQTTNTRTRKPLIHKGFRLLELIHDCRNSPSLFFNKDVPALLDQYDFFFNNQRRHAALGYKSPVQYRTKLVFPWLSFLLSTFAWQMRMVVFHVSTFFSPSHFAAGFLILLTWIQIISEGCLYVLYSRRRDSSGWEECKME